MKHVLFTHTDLDGAGCRILFEIFHAPEYEVFNAGNGMIDTVVKDNLAKYSKEDEIIFGDICPSMDLLQQLHDDGYNVKVFDHHATNGYAMDVLGPNGYVQSVPSENGLYESGTSMMWKYYITNKSNFVGKTSGSLADKFQNAVRSYDTYEWKETNYMEAKYLQILFGLLGMDGFCKHYEEYILTSDSDDLIPGNDQMFIDARLNAENMAIDNFIKNADLPDIAFGEYTGKFYYGPTGVNVSELANRYLEANPDVDFICVWTAGYNNVSFRTRRDDIDLGAYIALPLGGGGHPKAAGTSFSDEEMWNFTAMAMDMLTFKYDEGVDAVFPPKVNGAVNE